MIEYEDQNECGYTCSETEKEFMTTNLPQSEIQRFIRPNEIGRLTTFVCSPYHLHLKVLQSVWMGEWYRLFFSIFYSLNCYNYKKHLTIGFSNIIVLEFPITGSGAQYGIL